MTERVWDRFLTEQDRAGMPGWSEAIHAAGGRSATRTASSLPADRVLHRYDVLPEVAPVDGEVVLRKTAPSAFWGTPLMAELNRLDVDTLIVAGESTSGCVRASVVDAASYRFRVIVVEECVFDRHEAPHAINLFDMHQKYADVIPLDTALDYIRQVSGGASTPAREL